MPRGGSVDYLQEAVISGRGKLIKDIKAGHIARPLMGHAMPLD